MFLKGDLVECIGSHGIGPEVTSVIGTIVGPWTVEEWWVILVGDELINWPESQMGFLERAE